MSTIGNLLDFLDAALEDDVAGQVEAIKLLAYDVKHPTFDIVPGFTPEGERVFRVVEWVGDDCLGGRGSFFKRSDAEAFIVAEQIKSTYR